MLRYLLAAAVAVLAVAAPAGAAEIEVTTAGDELNGDTDCSLREAVQAANTNAAVSGCNKGQGSKRDTVKLQPGVLYELEIPSTNENANANGDLDITGSGPLTIKGNARGMAGPLIFTQEDDRVIDVLGSGAVKVQKLNLEGDDVSGNASGDDEGGVIRAEGATLMVDDVNVEGGVADVGGGIAGLERNLTVTDSFIGDNEATDGGGGIYAVGVNRLKLSRSGVSSNSVEGTTVDGGGVWSSAERTEIVDTEITFNDVATTTPGGSAVGGGIFGAGPDLVVRRSLIEGNNSDDIGGSSNSFGGGIQYLGQGGQLELVNSTLFDNDTDGTGGGFHARKASVANVTFFGNDAGDDGDHMSAVATGPVKFRNSIIAGGLFTDTCTGDPGSFVSKGFSVIQFDDPTCAFRDSDPVVTDIGFADGTPVPNGGETFTMGIKNSSPAKNLIPKRKCKVAQREDQRDFVRPVGRKCDAGAFERGAKKN